MIDYPPCTVILRTERLNTSREVTPRPISQASCTSHACSAALIGVTPLRNDTGTYTDCANGSTLAMARSQFGIICNGTIAPLKNVTTATRTTLRPHVSVL